MNRRRDIETIIDEVRTALPHVEVIQLRAKHPRADDDGLWCFRLPGVARDIQLESSTYDCPFLVEHSDIAAASDALTARSVPEAISLVVAYLRPLRFPGLSPIS